MAVKAAEEFILNCHCCNKDLVPSDTRIPTYREGRFWYECYDCYNKNGGVTWAKLNRIGD